MAPARQSSIWRTTPFWLIVAALCPLACGKTIYVDDDATGANDGTSWANAYVYLQDALADAGYHLKSQAGRWDAGSESWVLDDVTSPCIDAGDPNSSVALEPFPNGGQVNMGAYGGTAEASKSAHGTGTYRFVPDRSTIVQTGGIAGVHWTYSVEGQFRLAVDFETGSAKFLHVDVTATDDSVAARTLDVNDVFNMTSLLGTIGDGSISFAGKAGDGSAVRITVTLHDDLAQLVGETSPPPGSADFFIFNMDALAQSKYGGGTGEPNDPYLICTAEHLNAVGAEPNDWDKHFKLMADIDLSSITGTDFSIIGYHVSRQDNRPFTGTFDGSGHTISNFRYISTDASNTGLFGYVADPNAEIRDLGLIDPNIVAKRGDAVGLLVGRLSEGTVTGCYVKGGSVLGSSTVRNVGGLVGDNCLGTIANCYSSASVSGRTNVGGLVGWNRGGITNCTSSGSVSGNDRVGGLVGNNSFGTITNCHSSANVSGTMHVGGLAGYNDYSDTITNCSSSGSVSGTRGYVGGLVGYNGGGIITDSYSLGSVIGGECVGGLVGYNGHWPGTITITKCYSAGSVLGMTDVGGLVGSNEGDVKGSFWDIQTSEQSTSAGGTGKTTSEMQIERTFTDAGWDFVNERNNGTEDIWSIDEGTGYPRLAWESEPREPPTAPPYGGGTGTQANPYLIYTAEQLNMIGLFQHDWGRHFKLMADIDLSGFSGTDFNIIGYFGSSLDDDQPFFGVFDGDGRKIANFNYHSETAQSHTALFAYVDGEHAVIKDLGLIDPNIEVGTSWISWRTASLVAVNSGTISNCCVQGGMVSGSGEVGGLVANNLYGTIRNCYSATDVSGDAHVGGLVGHNHDGTIINSYSTASVSGYMIMGILLNVGGLVGINSVGEITACFWDIETSGRATSAGGTGTTRADMQTAGTFLEAGWDFMDETENGTEDIWWILEGRDYPRLWWEMADETPR